jgi:hypothetical protein
LSAQQAQLGQLREDPSPLCTGDEHRELKTVSKLYL